MALDVDASGHEPDLGDSFRQRLEESLERADRTRGRRRLAHQLRRAAPLIMLIGPIVAWRLILSTPDGVHVGIAALAWITFALDVAVHIDGSLLSSLNLQFLPTVVGFVIFVLVTATLLLPDRDGK